MSGTDSTARVHGLDTLRALAVSLVVLHHYTLFVSRNPSFGWVGEIGWAGVDLFFALSGYLIGDQIFKAQRSSAGFSLGRFYARRFLRTLPNYWFVLALYACWPAFRGDAPLLPLWKYLSFTQNYHLEPGTAFSHSWSLSIEEQFYMLLPTLVVCAGALRRSLGWAWLAIAIAFVAGMVTRAHIWHEVVPGQPIHSYYKFIYYSSFCRFDELLAGVALALAKNCHPRAWRRITGYGNLDRARVLAVSERSLRHGDDGVRLSAAGTGLFDPDRRRCLARFAPGYAARAARQSARAMVVCDLPDPQAGLRARRRAARRTWRRPRVARGDRHPARAGRTGRLAALPRGRDALHGPARTLRAVQRGARGPLPPASSLSAPAPR